MRQRSRSSVSNENMEVWPAFTDLMSNAFMILSLLLLLAIVKSAFLKSISDQTKTRSEQLEEQIASLQNDLEQKNDRIAGFQGRVASLQADLQQRSDEITLLEGEIERLKSPPIIVLRDSRDRKFESGSAELSQQLSQFIQEDLVKQVETQAKNYQGYVVEVIGHTDGQINQGTVSNLDIILERVAAGNQSVSNLSPGSNADLGLMRALAVVQELQKNQRLKELGLKFRAYSAAQLYNPGGNYAPTNRNPDTNRRRIEIRFSPPAVER